MKGTFSKTIVYGAVLVFCGVTIGQGHIDVARAQTVANSEQEAGDSSSVLNYTQPMAPEQLKQLLLKNAKAIHESGTSSGGDGYSTKRNQLTISNQTSLSGHIKEVFQPLFEELGKLPHDLDDNGYLYQLNVTKSGLTTQDLRDLVDVIGAAPANDYLKFHPDDKQGNDNHVTQLNVGGNKIGDFSNLHVEENHLELVTGLGQTYNPDDSTRLPTLTVDKTGQVVIPKKELASFFGENSGFTTFRAVANGHTEDYTANPESIDDGGYLEILQKVNLQNPDDDLNTTELSLDYGKAGWMAIPEDYDTESALLGLGWKESDRDKNKAGKESYEAYVADLAKQNFTVDSYRAYLLNKLSAGQVTIKNIPSDAKSLRLRLFANLSYERGATVVVQFPLNGANISGSTGSSSTTPTAPTDSPKTSPSTGTSSNNNPNPKTAPSIGTSGNPNPNSKTIPSTDTSASLKTLSINASANSGTNANFGANPSTNDDKAAGQSIVEIIPDTAYPVAKKNQAVFSVRKIHMYKGANFNKKQQIASYQKKPRINRPMFVVEGYRYSTTGKLRYRVRDVNHRSKTAGKVGYISANGKYVQPAYYSKTHKTVTVIEPQGVTGYANKSLTGKRKHYRQGTHLKVAKVVNHHLATRFLLTNGHYITANRKLVAAGKVKQPKQITVKRTTRRYQAANLTKHNGFFKKGTKLTVKRYAFSQASSMAQSGTKVYEVKGGYITANPKLTKVQY